MNLLEQKLREYATQQPYKLAIDGDDIQLDYQSLFNEIEILSSTLGFPGSFDPQQKSHTFAIVMDNHPAWAVLDLSLLFNHQCSVPLPKFFSVQQLKHAIKDSAVEFLILDNADINKQLIRETEGLVQNYETIEVAGKALAFYRLNIFNPEVAENLSTREQNQQKIIKITYTSGTTSHPKGVMLSEDIIMTKVVALSRASEANADDRSLCILPLSTLLENIGGLYVPLYCGASIILLSPQTTGLSGSSQIDHKKLIAAVLQYRPTAFIIIPQLLLLLIKLIQSGIQLPDSLRFIAMGGAPVSRQLLDMAEQLEIPVFEGYGLSEAASVVAVNNPTHHRLGSVGKVLDTHELKISEEGEILLKNHLFSGYLGQPAVNSNDFYATGDIGKLDEEAYLYVTGRKKNVINTSYGRNISPEWLEKELEVIPAIAQCVVYGHGRPFLVAIVVLRDNSEQAVGHLRQTMEQLNKQLPDYAWIKDFIVAREAFGVGNELLTGTGRVRREQIYQVYRQALESCYGEQKCISEN